MLSYTNVQLQTRVVYLAGLISTDYTESLMWRVYAEKQLQEEGFSVLSPMRGKQNLVITSKDGGLTDPNLTPKDIIIRDWHDVSQADVILMHLENFGSPRPLLGTICELAWAWQLKTPIVAVASKENLLMRTHPFVVEAVSHYAETVDEAIRFTTRHYGPAY